MMSAWFWMTNSWLNTGGPSVLAWGRLRRLAIAPDRSRQIASPLRTESTRCFIKQSMNGGDIPYCPVNYPHTCTMRIHDKWIHDCTMWVSTCTKWVHAARYLITCWLSWKKLVELWLSWLAGCCSSTILQLVGCIIIIMTPFLSCTHQYKCTEFSSIIGSVCALWVHWAQVHLHCK